MIDIILFFIYVTVYTTVVSIYNFGHPVANLRYYVLFLLCILSAIVYLISKKTKNKKIFGKENLYLIVVSLVFLVFSYIKACSVSMSLNLRTFVQISLFLLPTLYSFYVVNFISKKHIYAMLKIALVIIIITYFFDMQEVKHNILEFFRISNWLSIDYLHSVSFTESHNWAETFLQLFLFFFFAYHTDKNDKSLKRYCITSLIFTLLAFKRLGMLFALFICFFGKKIIEKNNFKKNHKILLTFTFVISTIFYISFMQGKIFDYNTVFSLTTGRNWILKLWEMKGYLSYGYGTSMLVIGRYLEMDLVEIYMELNIFCLIIFIYSYFNICKKNIYANIIMIYVLANMLTASSLPWQISWVIMMINISFIVNFDSISNNSIKKGYLYE